MYGEWVVAVAKGQNSAASASAYDKSCLGDHDANRPRDRVRRCGETGARDKYYQDNLKNTVLFHAPCRCWPGRLGRPEDCRPAVGLLRRAVLDGITQGRFAHAPPAPTPQHRP